MQSIYARLTLEQRTAMCFESDMSTALVGGGACSAILLRLRCVLPKGYAQFLQVGRTAAQWTLFEGGVGLAALLPSHCGISPRQWEANSC